MQEQQSQLEAATVFLDSVVTQVSAVHLQSDAAYSPAKAGILRQLEALLQQVCTAVPSRHPARPHKEPKLTEN